MAPPQDYNNQGEGADTSEEPVHTESGMGGCDGLVTVLSHDLLSLLPCILTMQWGLTGSQLVS